MADWYVSSVANLALPQYQISHAYIIGDIVRRITPTVNSNGAFRCTTAGTSAASEPTWPTANNGTVTTGTAVFTNVSGQSAFGWGAAAGDLGTVDGGIWVSRLVGGDTAYLSSDHAESFTTFVFGILASFAEVRIISVNRAGSVPPVAADILSGASFTATSIFTINCAAPLYFSGVTFSATTTLNFNSNAAKAIYLKNCALIISGAGTTNRITTNNPTRMTWDNTTVQFANASQGIASTSYLFDVTWINTATPVVSGTLPTSLLSGTAISGGMMLTARGVDFSALGSGKTIVTNSTGGAKVLLDSCKIDPAVTRYSTTGIAAQNDDLDLVNCFDGTNILNERYTASGTLTTERTIVLANGAEDDVGLYSHKMVSSANSSTYTFPLASFWLDVENTVTGVSRTATVEIISSSTLTNSDIYLKLEYQATSSSSVATIASTLPTTPLTASSNLPTSGVTWNSSPATPVKQNLTLTFTAQVAGRVRAQVYLGKVSTTVYVNPVVQIS